ncbi:MAG: transporter substrate-binding domain-containing protein [Nitrospinae bacterium]|nr:transporter substrate-binding domain-containing protein [Nitrospinota bacterium]
MALILSFPFNTEKKNSLNTLLEIRFEFYFRSLMYSKYMKTKFIIFPAFLITTIIFFFLLTGCNPKSGEKDNTYIVATDATLPPMSFMSVGNDMIGFEPDLMRAIADKAEMDIRLVNVEWAGLFGGLITNKFDMVISSVTVLEERKQRMDFSVPYLKSGLALVVRKNEKIISSFEDAKKHNALVGAQVGTTSYFYLEKDPAVRAKGYQMYGHAISDLINGKVDAVLGESSGTLFLKNKPLFQEIKMVGEMLSNEYYAIVLRKKESKLMDRINSAIKDLIADGTVARLHKKWELGQAAQVAQ